LSITNYNDRVPPSLDISTAAAVYSVHSIPSQKRAPLRAIYAIRNRVTGNLYVGSAEHVVRRFRSHLSRLRRGVHHSVRLQWAWRNRGEDAFEFIVIKIISPDEDLIAKEGDAVAALRPAYNFNLRFVDNPMRGRRHSRESIEKMRNNRRGKGLGKRIFSAAHRAALSQALKGKPSPNKGFRYSAASRAKMSESAKRRFASGYVSSRTRPVEVNGMTFFSGRTAAESLGISHPVLVKRIKRGFGRYLDQPDNGEGRRQIPPYVSPKGSAHGGARAIVVDGVQFGSISEASAHFGRSPATLNYWLQRGRAKYADGGRAPHLRSIYKPRAQDTRSA
jgi:group I intron endonuclease